MWRAGSLSRHGPPWRHDKFTPPHGPRASAEALTNKLSLKPVTVTIQRWINSLKTTDGSYGPGTDGPAGFRCCGGIGFRPALRINVVMGVDRSRWPLWSYTRTFCQVTSTTCLSLTPAFISGQAQWVTPVLQTVSPGPVSPSKE